MRFVAIISHGPNWIVGKPVTEQGEPMRGHLAKMDQRFGEGSLLIGGPFGSGDGGLAVLETESMERAREIMEEDPGVLAGVLTYELKEHILYFDTITGTRQTTMRGRPPKT